MQLQDTVIQVILLIAFLVATPLYFRHFWKHRIPHTPDRWGFPIDYFVLIWIVMGNSTGPFFSDSWLGNIPPLGQTFIIPVAVVVIHFCGWRICLFLKPRQEKTAREG